MKNNPSIDSFKNAILQSASSDEAFQAVAGFFESYGFPEAYYSYAAVSSNPKRLNGLYIEKLVIVHSTMRPSRHDYFTHDYNEKRLFDTDPALRPFHHGNTEIFMSGLNYVESGALELSPDDQVFMEEKRQTLGGAQIIFPVMTPITSRLPSGSLTAVSDLKGDALNRATKAVIAAAEPVIELFVEATTSYTTDIMANGVKLTPRERECLQYLSMGYRTIDIADKLGRSKSMVDQHVWSARKKLSAKTLPEAVARALTLNIIHL